MRYKLRTLLIAITICCGVLGRVVYVRQQRDIHREALSKIFSLYPQSVRRMEVDHWYEARRHSRLANRYDDESHLIVFGRESVEGFVDGQDLFWRRIYCWVDIVSSTRLKVP